MRKLVLVAALVLAGVLVARRIRSRAAAPGSPAMPATPPSAHRSPVADEPAVDRSGEAVDPEPAPPVPAPPRPTTNGERVVLMSISSLQERGQDATHEAVVAHVAAGEIDPDEAT